MKKVPLLLLACIAVSAYGQQSIPAGSSVFVDTNNGFDIFILAALQNKHVPLVLVSSRERADYVLDSALFHTDAFVATNKVAGTYRVSESAFKLTTKSGEIIWAYAATKGMFSKGKQSVAEACAKHLKHIVSQNMQRAQLSPVIQNGVIEVTFTSTPANTLVTIGGMGLGRTPFTTKLAPGFYKATFSVAGFASSVQNMQVGLGYPTTIDATLQALQATNR
jgi:hypothetical protein